MHNEVSGAVDGTVLQTQDVGEVHIDQGPVQHIIASGAGSHAQGVINGTIHNHPAQDR